MGFFDFINHFFNFLAPAAVVGLLLSLVGPWFGLKYSSSWSLGRQMVLNTLVGVGVLLCGLFFFGRDGKMASYAAMVLACAACQCAVSMRRA